MKLSSKIILSGFIFFLNMNLTNLQAQKVKIGLIDMDSIYVKVGFMVKNDSIVQRFKFLFTEKDSFMVTEFVKKVEEYQSSLQNSDPSPIESERRLNELSKEQKRIQKFEKSVEDASVFLEKELKLWSEDYIRKEIRFVYYSQEYRAILIKKDVVFIVDSPEDITNLVIDAIKINNQWASAHADFVQFVLNKTIFHFQLE